MKVLTKSKSIDVLLIQNDLLCTDMINQLLSIYGKSTFCIKNAQTLTKGLKLLNSRSFDVILLDLSLPDFNGMDAFKRLNDHSDIPIIVLSGLNLKRSEIRTCLETANKYFVKGYIDAYSLGDSILMAQPKQRKCRTWARSIFNKKRLAVS